jgi:hypothetical protein
MLRNAGLALSLVLSVAACVGQQPAGDGDDDAVDEGDAGGGGGDDVDATPETPPDTSVHVPVDADRPVDIMPPSRLGMIAPRMPHVADPWLKAVLESPDTMWYDRLSIIPGYQDSFGDNTQLPIGMRPNSIDPQMINLAVPGGHQQLFIEHGLFHFPFGRGIGTAARDDNFVVNFWQLPRDQAGAIVPVVYYQRDPNTYTHRVEWMFPKGTVFGEIIFQIDAGDTWYPFEIRVRVRELDHWRNDVYRPFPTANDLAVALEAAAATNPAWATADVAALAAHARNGGTLAAEALGATHYASAFPSTPGAKDVLPALADPAVLKHLLVTVPYRSAKGLPWKQQGNLVAHAATTQASFHIVPKDYDGGHLEVSDDACKRCHQDAGRPFRDWYPNVIAYGELWGGDDVFTWHPFDAANFVDASGNVRNFNYDNRRIRPDFTAGGVIVRYAPAQHPATTWGQLPGAWKNYAY